MKMKNPKENKQPNIFVAMTEDGPIVSPDVEQIILDLKDAYEAIEWTKHVNLFGNTIVTFRCGDGEVTAIIYKASFVGVQTELSKLAYALLSENTASEAA